MAGAKYEIHFFDGSIYSRNIKSCKDAFFEGESTEDIANRIVMCIYGLQILGILWL